MSSRTADYSLEAAFNELVAGVFTLSSELGGSDVLADLGAFAGTYDDLTDDVDGDIVVETGTDSLVGAVQASSLTVTVSRESDPSYWNPNNPASPLNGVTPGFVPMRPGRLQATQDATTSGIFWGFLRHATWNATSRSCELYFEDVLLWGNRVYPVIASTGPTTTGAAIGLCLDAMGWTDTSYRDLAAGDSIDDFSADGTQSVLQLIAALLEAERGTVYVRGDGVVVYESRDMVQTRASSATLADELNALGSGIDLDSIFTRASVTKTGGSTMTSIDADAEHRYGRADLGAIDSPYIASDTAAQALADDLVWEGAQGTPPITLSLDNGDGATLTTILGSPLLSLFTIAETLGGTTGDYVVQRIVHTITPGDDVQHVAEYTLTKRPGRAFALDSELGGTDVFRY